jgi:hypothetical protein
MQTALSTSLFTGVHFGQVKASMVASAVMHSNHIDLDLFKETLIKQNKTKHV